MEKSNAEYIAYLLLQNKYLEKRGMKDVSDDYLLRNGYKFYPEDWFISYSQDAKIKLLTYALQKDINLSNLSDEEIMKILNPNMEVTHGKK